MIASRFVVPVPLPSRDEVFLYHTLSEAHVLVSGDVHRALFTPGGDHGDDEALDEARDVLASLGFLVGNTDDDDRAVRAHFAGTKDDREELRVTVLTTLRCNAACGYCVQGAHDRHAPHMSLETAERVAGWIESRLDEVAPSRLVVTFFGGEPLLNVAALEHVARRTQEAGRTRGVAVAHVVVTNGVLLTRPLVERLVALGLRTVKVTLDGDADAHDRLRPLRGGQGTFARIFENLAAISGLCRISIGGNLDADAEDGTTRLLDAIAAAPFAPSIGVVSFKPVIRTAPTPRVIPLRAVAHPGEAQTVPAGSACDTCGFADDRWMWLREETRRRGLPAPAGVSMGPCEIHRRHSHTVGPDGRLFACPGYAGSDAHAVGHIARPSTAAEQQMGERRDAPRGVARVRDCAFVPACAGGCSVAAHHEHQDMEAPSCHKPALVSAVAELAKSCEQQEEEVPA